MKQESGHIDALTNFFGYAYGSKKIDEVLQRGGGHDTALLFQVDNWEGFCELAGDKAADFSLAKLSFLLTKLFHKTDIFVRIAPAAFFVYSYGYMESADIQRRLQLLYTHMKTTASLARCLKECRLHAGVSHVQKECSFQELLTLTQYALAQAVEQDLLFAADCQVKDAQKPLSYAYPQEIPVHAWDYQDIDVRFIIDMTNFLFGCNDLHFGLEMVLSCMCEYFDTQQIYVMERDSSDEGYAITHEWLCHDQQVENANFRRLPLTVGDRHQKLFDEHHLLVCSQLSDMFKYDVVTALRERVRGAQALLQCALYDNGRYIGYLSMLDCQSERVWTSTETATFSTLVKIIGTAIMQLRSQRISEQIVRNDMLTGAWNLKTFTQTVEQYLQEHPSACTAVITLDIKNFKFINAEYGYPYGNAILISISQILKLYLDAQEYYARGDGDNFVVMLQYQDMEQLKLRITSLIQKIERCGVHSNPPVTVVCMMGVYISRHSGRSVSEMLDCANMARKSVKNSHKSAYAFFNKEIEAQHMREHSLTRIMKQALQDAEFIIYYQPKVNIRTQKCVGLEALVRWKRADGELIQPNDFIPLFEKNKFIGELDMYVLEMVCRQLQEWQERNAVSFPIAVNLSRIHLEEDADIVYHIVNICNRYHIQRQLIELEITETAFLENETVVIQRAKELKQAGFLLSMDDFGTGFSSLNLLSELPVDSLKLDRTFFLKESNQREKIILSNIVHMAEELNMHVISEGIETAQQVDFLKEIGCDIAQGYYYSRPCPMEQLQKRLWTVFEGGDSHVT